MATLELPMIDTAVQQVHEHDHVSPASGSTTAGERIRTRSFGFSSEAEATPVINMKNNTEHEEKGSGDISLPELIYVGGNGFFYGKLNCEQVVSMKLEGRAHKYNLMVYDKKGGWRNINSDEAPVEICIPDDEGNCGTDWKRVTDGIFRHGDGGIRQENVSFKADELSQKYGEQILDTSSVVIDETTHKMYFWVGGNLREFTGV